MIDVTTLEEQILSLNPNDRRRLASSLVRSLDESMDELDPAEWEMLWAQECRKRVAEMECGEERGVAWEDVKAEARQLVR